MVSMANPHPRNTAAVSNAQQLGVHLVKSFHQGKGELLMQYVIDERGNFLKDKVLDANRIVRIGIFFTDDLQSKSPLLCFYEPPNPQLPSVLFIGVSTVTEFA